MHINNGASMMMSNMVTDIEDLHKNMKVCQFYETFQKKAPTFRFPSGVYTLEDLRDFGRKETMCPYFMSRHFLMQANIIVYNYAYMLDPKISNLVSREL